MKIEAVQRRFVDCDLLQVDHGKPQLCLSPGNLLRNFMWHLQLGPLPLLLRSQVEVSLWKVLRFSEMPLCPRGH